MTEPKTRTLLMSFRQAIIIILGALEDYLEMRRSIVPRRKREAHERCQEDRIAGIPPPGLFDE